MPRCLVKRNSWLYLWGCFIDSVDWVKGSTLISVSRHHPIFWGPDGTKRQKKGNFSLFLTQDVPLLLPLDVTAPKFSGFELQDLHHRHLPLVPRPSDRLNYTLRLQFSEGRLLSLHNHVSKCLWPLFLCMSLYVLLALSLWRTLTNTLILHTTLHGLHFPTYKSGSERGDPQPESVKSQTYVRIFSEEKFHSSSVQASNLSTC